MLLTLIRYGFYLSSNSILCLTEKEKRFWYIWLSNIGKKH
jgi:hypothetical protein